MKINELIAEQQNMEEGIGSFLGKAAGNIAGGVGAAWRDAKQGYKDAKAVWDPKDPPGTYNNDPATNATAPAGSPSPTELRQQAAALTQQADQLEKTATRPAPAPANTTAPAPTQQGTPPVDKTGKTDYNLGKQSDGKFIFPGQKFDSTSGAPLGGEPPTAEPQPAPAAEPTTPEPAPQQAPTPTVPPAGTPPSTGSKLTPQQIAAKKAELQGKRAAGKTTATQTGGGFKDYVGGSGERMTGVDASGAPVYQKIQRESVEFRSNFLGMMI